MALIPPGHFESTDELDKEGYRYTYPHNFMCTYLLSELLFICNEMRDVHRRESGMADIKTKLMGMPPERRGQLLAKQYERERNTWVDIFSFFTCGGVWKLKTNLLLIECGGWSSIVLHNVIVNIRSTPYAEQFDIVKQVIDKCNAKGKDQCWESLNHAVNHLITHGKFTRGEVDVLILDLVCEYGLDPNTLYEGSTPLHELCAYNNLNSAEKQIKYVIHLFNILVKWGAKLDVKDRDGYTPLDLYRYHKKTQMCANLLKYIELWEEWTMNELQFGSYVQWLPNELVEDLCESIFCTY